MDSDTSPWGRFANMLTLQDRRRSTRSVGLETARLTEQLLSVLAAFMDGASDAVFWKDGAARFVYVNVAACGSVRYSAEEPLRLTLFDINPDATPEAGRSSWRTYGPTARYGERAATGGRTARSSRSGSEEEAGVGEILAAAERSRNLTRQLLATGQRQALEMRPLDLRQVIRGAVALLRRTLRESTRILV